LPFDQDLKRKTVVRVDGADHERCRVYVKGAPEEIIAICNDTLDQEVNARKFGQKDRNNIMGIIERDICKKGMKPLSYGFKMVANAELSKQLANVDEDSLEYRSIFESDLIYLGTFGLEDPVRPSIKEDIN
jgi:magnesium-transporting ATPase (P-type)